MEQIKEVYLFHYNIFTILKKVKIVKYKYKLFYYYTSLIPTQFGSLKLNTTFINIEFLNQYLLYFGETSQLFLCNLC